MLEMPHVSWIHPSSYEIWPLELVPMSVSQRFWPSTPNVFWTNWVIRWNSKISLYFQIRSIREWSLTARTSWAILFLLQQVTLPTWTQGMKNKLQSLGGGISPWKEKAQKKAQTWWEGFYWFMQEKSLNSLTLLHRAQVSAHNDWIG